MVNQASGYPGAGTVPQMMGNRHPSICAVPDAFDTADRPIAVAVGNDKQFLAFATSPSVSRRAGRRSPVRHQLHSGSPTGCSCAIASKPAMKKNGADHW